MSAYPHTTGSTGDTAMLSADDIIALFGLTPHPEGGAFRETFRDTSEVTYQGHPRSTGTAIYFLLRQGEVSRWHTVDAAEGWHFYAGAPLGLDIAAPNGPAVRTVLGTNFSSGERPQAVVPSGHWQRAQSLGTWTLVGCTVSPGFEFSGFVLAYPDFNPPSA